LNKGIFIDTLNKLVNCLIISSHLHELVKTCNFCNDACIQKNICNQTIEGLSDEGTVENLSQETDLKLAKALHKYQEQEAAKKQWAALHSNDSDSIAAL